MQHRIDPLLAKADIATVVAEMNRSLEGTEGSHQHWMEVRADVAASGGDTMPSHPDSLPAEDDIAAVVAETGLSRAVVARLHERLIEVHGKAPTRRDLRHYAAYGAEHLGEGGFRLYFEMPADPDHPASPEALRNLEELAAKAEAWRNWRPPRTWTKGAFQLRYFDACICTTPPYTPRSVAPYFVTLAGKRGIDPDHLRRLVRRFGVLRYKDGRFTGDDE